MASPSMSSTVSPASAIAARIASRVSWKPERSILRPIADWPTPEMTARRSRSSVPIKPPPPVPPESSSSVQRVETRDGIAARTWLEAHFDGHADGRGLRRTAAQSADYPNTGMLVELDQDDDVGNLKLGKPALVVDREAVHPPAAGDLRRYHRSASAITAHPPRRKVVTPARRASLDDQSPLARRNREISSAGKPAAKSVSVVCSPDRGTRPGLAGVRLKRGAAPGWTMPSISTKVRLVTL